VKNQVKNAWEALHNAASATNLRDLRFTISGNVANYVSTGGKVEVIVRSIKPDRLGTTAIVYRIDCVNVIARYSN
jgi:hypothetical protein